MSFERPEAEIVLFDAESFIATSVETTSVTTKVSGGGIELPDDNW